MSCTQSAIFMESSWWEWCWWCYYIGPCYFIRPS